jgi:hypothetical protein
MFAFLFGMSQSYLVLPDDITKFLLQVTINAAHNVLRFSAIVLPCEIEIKKC